MLRQIFIAAALVAAVLATTRVHAENGNPNPGVLPINSHAYGTTYGELAGEWWSWAFKTPFDSNPITDTTGEFAAEGQEGKVWFLAGTFGETGVVRDVTVPAGKAIFFPIVNSLFITPEEGADEAAVRLLANEFIDPASVLEATIDGVAVEDLFSYRAESPAGGFALSAPAGGLIEDLGLPPGDRDPSVADGYWLLLAPLSVGEHEISFYAALGDPAAPDFETGVTYNLTVAPNAKAVPEPATAALAVLGLTLSLAGCRRRRRRV
jgi:hypothetical protein